MLNEYMEYNDYTDVSLVDFENNWENITFTPNVNTELIVDTPKKKAFKGLERVLTVIARYRLFDVYKYNEFETKSVSSKGFSQRETIDIVKSELASWCGFSDEVSSFEAKNWLKHYYDNIANYPVEIDDKGAGRKPPSIKNTNAPVRLKPEIFLPTEKPKENFLINVPAILRSDAKLIYSWEQIVKDKSEKFKYKLFFGTPKDSNTFKALNYEKVIASAINLGKLNTFYLLVKEGFTSELMVKNENKTSFPINKKQLSKVDILLKYIGVFLIESKYTSKQQYIVFDTSSFSLWANNDLQKHDISFINSDNEKIIRKYADIDNVRLTDILPEYLEKYGFAIIERTEMVNSVMNNKTYSDQYNENISEEELLKLYLKIVNKGTEPDEPKFIIFSDGGFGKPLIKHTAD